MKILIDWALIAMHALNHIIIFFQDLCSWELNSELYLVAHVVRLGRMLFTESSKKSSAQSYRRPHGIAMFRLDPGFIQGADGEVI